MRFVDDGRCQVRSQAADDPLRNSGSMISHLFGSLLRLLQLDHIISNSGQQFIERINLGVATFSFISI
jgi:hypothetical protein